MVLYVHILGLFYLRLTRSDLDVYCYLEPLYNDHRKLRLKLSDSDGSKFHFDSMDPLVLLTHVDEIIEELLSKVCNTTLYVKGSTAKEANFTRESSWRERLHVHVKRAVRPSHATVLQHKKSTSSSEDDITGGSRWTSQTAVRQEVPTATS
ncbi:hypothetical protein Bca52824_027833 [Brassica carinata]|uniref:Pre-mRNA-splicing factor 38 n=1 Tax=Brassica carinata TaxID=52824 RepID=A0A8X7VBC7_BRACI|nr:hypothetical protein Bca52824_027833 [Brassica carinata]